MKLTLFIKEIKDEFIRDNFRFLRDFIQAQRIIQDWVFLEFEVAQAITNMKVKHGLTATPKDIIQTSKTGLGSVTFNHALFDNVNIDVTTTGACKVRFLVGNIVAVGG